MFFFIVLFVTLIITIIDFNSGKSIANIAVDSFKQMISVLPPIMLLLGLLDIWVPITAVFIKKGVKFSNVMIFLGAWCTTKIPTLLFELSALGYKYTFTRMFVNLPFIIILGYLIEGLLKEEDLKEIYKN